MFCLYPSTLLYRCLSFFIKKQQKCLFSQIFPPLFVYYYLRTALCMPLHTASCTVCSIIQDNENPSLKKESGTDCLCVRPAVKSFTVYAPLLFLLIHRRYHLHIIIQHLRRAGVIMLLLIKRNNLRHLLIRQDKIKQIQIRLDVRRIFGTRDDHIARLHMPPQNNLRVGLAVFFCKCGKYRLLNQRLIAVSKRIPCLNHYILFCKERL